MSAIRSEVELARLRAAMDEIDEDLRRTLQARARLARRIARVKRMSGHPPRDVRREREVLTRLQRRASSAGYDAEEIELIVRALLRATHRMIRRCAEPPGGPIVT